MSDLARHSLIFMLMLPCFFPAETTSIILMFVFFAWVMFSGFLINRNLIYLVAPFLLMLVIGAHGAFQHPQIDVVKDIWYVGKIVVSIASGYVLARFFVDFSKIYKTIIFAGLFAAVIHMVEIATFWHSGASFFELRAGKGIGGYFITVLGLALLTSQSRKMFQLNRVTYYFITLFCSLSLLLSFSRTNIISYIVLFFILKGWVRVSFSNFTKILGAGFAAAAMVVILTQFDTVGEKSLSDKFINSFNEIAVSDYSDIRDINLHWRGFESYKALEDFQGGSLLQKTFGQGFGATVDLGFYIQLGDSELRYIPILHNGYLYVLVKLGVVGLLIYLFFLLNVIRSISYLSSQNSTTLQGLIASRLVAGIGWCLLLTTFVIAGPFNKSAMLPALVILGLLVGMNHYRK